jgi:hypothetical protein
MVGMGSNSIILLALCLVFSLLLIGPLLWMCFLSLTYRLRQLQRGRRLKARLGEAELALGELGGRLDRLGSKLSWLEGTLAVRDCEQPAGAAQPPSYQESQSQSGEGGRTQGRGPGGRSDHRAEVDQRQEVDPRHIRRPQVEQRQDPRPEVDQRQDPRPEVDQRQDRRPEVNSRQDRRPEVEQSQSAMTGSNEGQRESQRIEVDQGRSQRIEAGKTEGQREEQSQIPKLEVDKRWEASIQRWIGGGLAESPSLYGEMPDLKHRQSQNQIYANVSIV